MVEDQLKIKKSLEEKKEATGEKENTTTGERETNIVEENKVDDDPLVEKRKETLSNPNPSLSKDVVSLL